MAADGAFADLRKLAEWFEGAEGVSWTRIERITRRLGPLAVPLLGRELRGADPRRRDAARDALAYLARIGTERSPSEGWSGAAVRSRVIQELRGVAARAESDDAKVSALGLLSELGEHATARFADPSAMQRRSALALAAQLDTPANVASTADLMIQQLGAGDLEQMLELLVEAAPTAARRLADELAARLDLPAAQRDRITGLVESIAPVAPASAGTDPSTGTSTDPGTAAAAPRRATRPVQVAVLVDAAARLVVVVGRRAPGARRSRRWAVLIGAAGRIDHCFHEEAPGEAAESGPLIAELCADGYRVASQDPDHARAIVAKAARLTAIDPEQLCSAYYLGRDLLELGDAHLGDRRGGDPAALALGRAIELLAAGEHTRARTLLARCDPRHPDVAAAMAACLLARGDDAEAVVHLTSAIAAEPDWPLHHWNLAIALQRQGDLDGCYAALRRFVATSAAPTGLFADPAQPGRVACAERMMIELERRARLAGRSLGSPRRARRQRP